MSLRNTLRAFPTLLRVGFSEALAYRAELLVWVLSTTMPFIMMALWTAVAREQPIGSYGTQAVEQHQPALRMRAAPAGSVGRGQDQGHVTHPEHREMTRGNDRPQQTDNRFRRRWAGCEASAGG